MVDLDDQYDVAILGGGLAGLAGAIQLAKKGFRVILFEKEKYPFHKVCGEYISLESWDFLQSLGLPLAEMKLPIIDTLQISAPDGTIVSSRLPLGGFGISRYTIDHLLAGIAKEAGVTLMEETKVTDVPFDGHFNVQFISKNTSTTSIKATVCCGSFGKRSNLDVKWKRSFIARKNPRINNFVGVKYHVKGGWPHNLIGLHNFKDGYCGLSKIEEDKYCLCYLTTADNLKNCGGSVEALNKTILFQNPVLHSLFKEAQFVADFPVTIAQISFSKKNQVQDHVLLLGDAAGMIAPLCGNGMSMALHSSKLAASVIGQFLDHNISRKEMEEAYTAIWQKEFSNRLETGRILQGFFGNKMLSNLFIRLFLFLPFLAGFVIKKTHGKPF